jgi:hypothetical protein
LTEGRDAGGKHHFHQRLYHHRTSMWIATHFALACIWLGCIVTDLITVRTLQPDGDGLRLQLSRLQWKLAAYVELPAFLGVLLTGGYSLATPRTVTTGFLVMLTVGLLTIFLNVFKVWLIRKRLSAALKGSWATHDKLVYFQRQLGALVLAGVVTAIAAGASGRIGG